MPVRGSSLFHRIIPPHCPSTQFVKQGCPKHIFQAIPAQMLRRGAAATLVAVLCYPDRLVVNGATCNSVEVTDPTSLRESIGWVNKDAGAGELIQGHVSAEVEAWGKGYLVAYGGTSVRTDDVNDVIADGSEVSIVDTTSPDVWMDLEMVAYDGTPGPLFRSAGFVWGNSLYLISGHTSEPFTVSDRMWRADINAFEQATEGLWRPVNGTVEDTLGGEIFDVARYGHTATVLDTGEADPTEIWVVVIGGMNGNQEGVETNLILYLTESEDTFDCRDSDLNTTTSTHTCAQRTHVRPTDSVGEWWRLDTRLSGTSSAGPAIRSYHAAGSIASDGLGNTACLFLFGGRDYENSVLYSDLWRLCPVDGFLGTSDDTTFDWTELSPSGTLPGGRYGATMSTGLKDAPYRLMLYAGTGRYPNTYMADAFTFEYDAYMNAWVDSSLEEGSSSYPVGRRDHTFEAAGDIMYLIAGINNDEDALRDMWTVNYSSPMCDFGNYMFFCEDTAAPVCGICPNGTATDRASYLCETCTSGYFASAGARECTPCPAGKYGTGDEGVTEATACSDCPAGTSTTYGVGTVNVDGCIICDAGTYSLEGALECLPCPSGFYSSTGASECIPCAVGMYRQQSSPSGDCYDCVAGTYAPFEQTSFCLDCPRGFYSEEGSSACSPCPAGTVGSRVAGGAMADACGDCGAGEYAEEGGTTTCILCPVGTASTTIAADNDNVCSTCDAGTYAGEGADVCAECVPGQFGTLPGTESCELCPVGTYVNATGSASAEDCEYCPVGSTTTTAGSTTSVDCLPCSPGTRSVSLSNGGGCEACPRGEYSSTYEEAQDFDCLQCAGGFYADGIGFDECPACIEDELSFNAHATCSACISNTSCPLGPNGGSCSGLGECHLGVCVCETGFAGVDCSDGTCDGCGGVIGFDFASAVRVAPEWEGTVSLTLVRLAGTDGDITVTVDVAESNTSDAADYGGTWPTQVTFLDGEIEGLVSFPVVHDNIPNEGCQIVTVSVTAVSGTGSAAVDGGIHDVSADAVVMIEEDDFTSAVLETVPREILEPGSGELSPATAEVVIADATATWATNVTLSVIGTTPADRSLALPLDLLLLAESEASVAVDVKRLTELLPGLAAEIQMAFNATMFGVAAFTTTTSSYTYELLESMTLDVYPAVIALNGVAADALLSSEGPPGAQVVGLYEAAEDGTNEAGWRLEDTLRVAVVVTGSRFAEASGFDSADTSTWTIPHEVTVPMLESRLSAAGVHPLFLLTDASLYSEYEALVREIGFGGVVALDQDDAMANNYNDRYLPAALWEGLEIMYAQSALLVEADDGGFVSSISPAPNAFRNETAGTEVAFLVNMSATEASSTGGGEVTLSFQGHKTVITVVREFISCDMSERVRVSGADAAALDDTRAGWLQGFHADEETKWMFDDSFFSLGNGTTGPFGVTTRSLEVSCPVGCTDEAAYQDITLATDSELPLALKAFFYLSSASTATSASATLDVTYIDGSTDLGLSSLDFSIASGGDDGTWTQNVVAAFPTEVISSVRVTLSFSGTGDATFAGVGLFAHPDVACRCSAGYYLDVSSAPALACTPQPECTYFEGWCTYCPAGYKCPQGGILTACLPGDYSMGGSTECSPCPVGWLCAEGLGVPCGYGISFTKKTTKVQEEEGSSSSISGLYGGSCVICPPGNACPGGGVVEECLPGSFSPGGGASNVCMPCRPGSFANSSAAGECLDCAPGFTSNYGAFECFECSPGFVTEAGQHPCVPCGTGTYAEAGEAACTPCAQGFYADEVAMWVCKACPGLTTTVSEGSVSKSDCV